VAGKRLASSPGFIATGVTDLMGFGVYAPLDDPDPHPIIGMAHTITRIVEFFMVIVFCD
jgi:hypothetical protein